MIKDDDKRRPSIAHLMLLTFSVAGFLSYISPQLRENLNFAICPLTEIEILCYGIGISCCWLGMVVVIRHRISLSRMLRLQPGESICVGEGTCFLLLLIVGALFNVFSNSHQDANQDWTHMTEATVVFFAVTLILAIAYFAWARRQSQFGWRVVGFTKAVAHMVAPLAMIAIVSGFFAESYAILQTTILSVYVLSTISVIVAAKHYAYSRPYRWTHWLGIMASCLIYVTRIGTEVRMLIGPH